MGASCSFLQSLKIQALGLSFLSAEKKKNPEQILEASQSFLFANLF